MTIRATHELHQRRFSRNLGLGLVLVAFIAIMFGLTVVKVTRGGSMQGYDHVVRPELLPADGASAAPAGGN